MGGKRDAAEECHLESSSGSCPHYAEIRILPKISDPQIFYSCEWATKGTNTEDKVPVSNVPSSVDDYFTWLSPDRESWPLWPVEHIWKKGSVLNQMVPIHNKMMGYVGKSVWASAKNINIVEERTEICIYLSVSVSLLVCEGGEYMMIHVKYSCSLFFRQCYRTLSSRQDVDSAIWNSKVFWWPSGDT